MKDSCWIFGFKVLGLIMITPTLATAVYISWLFRKSRIELIHNLAVCLWIIGNSVWMIGEFFFHDGLRSPAKIFFVAGMAILSGYYISLRTLQKK